MRLKNPHLYVNLDLWAFEMNWYFKNGKSKFHHRQGQTRKPLNLLQSPMTVSWQRNTEKGVRCYNDGKRIEQEGWRLISWVHDNRQFPLPHLRRLAIRCHSLVLWRMDSGDMSVLLVFWIWFPVPLCGFSSVNSISYHCFFSDAWMHLRFLSSGLLLALSLLQTGT